jgi:hypothetical protein
VLLIILVAISSILIKTVLNVTVVAINSIVNGAMVLVGVTLPIVLRVYVSSFAPQLIILIVVAINIIVSNFAITASVANVLINFKVLFFLLLLYTIFVYLPSVAM